MQEEEKVEDNVIRFYTANATKDPDVVLELAHGIYKQVLVLGWDAEGDLDIRASLDLDGPGALWLIEQFKIRLLHGDYADYESED